MFGALPLLRKLCLRLRELLHLHLLLPLLCLKLCFSLLIHYLLPLLLLLLRLLTTLLVESLLLRVHIDGHRSRHLCPSIVVLRLCDFHDGIDRFVDIRIVGAVSSRVFIEYASDALDDCDAALSLLWANVAQDDGEQAGAANGTDDDDDNIDQIAARFGWWRRR